MAKDNVDFTIFGELDRRSVQTIINNLRKAGDDGGDRFTDAFNRSAKPRPEVRGDFRTDGLRAGKDWTEGFRIAARQPMGNIAQDVSRDTRSITNSLNAATDSAATLGQAMAGIGKVAGPAGLATMAVGALQLASAIGTAAGALGVLPGVLAGVGAGFGTAKLGLMGFSDALDAMSDPEKFAEAIAKLAPNAQQAVLEIQQLMPALDQLKAATQDALFKDIAPQLNNLAATFLPQVQQLTTGIANGLNSALSGVFASMNSAAGQTGIASTVNNIVQAFGNLAPAAQSLTSAIGELVAVGSDFMPELAQGAADAAREFANFIHEASQSGELAQWMQDGITVLDQMVDVVAEVADMFMTLGGDGKNAMADLVVGVDAVDTAVKIVSGDMSAWNDVFPSIGDIAASTFQGIGEAIDTYVLGPMRAAIDVANSFGAGISQIPHIPSLAGSPQGFGGGGGSFGAPHVNVPGMPANGLPVPGASLGHSVGQANGPVAGWSGLPLDSLPHAGGGGASSKAIEMPTVARPGTDPTSLISGYPVSSGLYSAASSVLDAQFKVAQDNANLQKLLASNAAKEDQITKARNDLAQAQQDQVQAELRLQEAKDDANKKSLKGLQDAHGAFSELSAGLDKDLGFSKGLPGLADNMVKFVASLATAPLMGMLAPIAAQGNGAYGALGVAFGGSNSTASTASAAAQGMTLGGYPGDQALLSRVPKGIGQYDNATKDLSKGLVDCASGVEDLVNILDGKSTVGGSLWTGNASSVLPGMGFKPGMGGPGDFRVGYNEGHMQATLPGGTNVNFGSTSAIQAGGLDGGAGAYDPSFTSHYFRPTAGPATIPPAVPSITATPSTPSPVDLYGPTNTDPGLSNPLPPPGSLPGGGSMLPGAGAPQGLMPGVPYQAQGIDYQDPSWQPKGGGGIGITGGLLGAAMQAGIGAMGTAGAPFGGQAAAAAAQMGMQLMDRSIKFAGQAAGIGAEGLIDTFSVSNPDTGKNPLKDSWLWRAVGALAGATPAIGSGGAGLLDKSANKKAQSQQQGQNGQQQQQGNQQSGPLVHIENMGMDQGGKSTALDIAAHLQAQGYEAGMPR
ncbi:hypothetical protein ACXPWS_07635 [Mycobacterium sp. BMJ-28]